MGMDFFLNWLETALGMMSPLSHVLLGLWLLGMIGVPIVRWVFGEGAEKIGITVGVVLQIALVLSILYTSWGLGRTLGIWLLVSGIGWLSEVIGSRTGIPYGPYHYTDVLQPQLLRVPILIPLAWMMMMPPAWAVGYAASVMFGHPGMTIVGIGLAAAAFTSWDLYLDPQMVRWDFWRWTTPGYYFGIPLKNYVGWFLVAFLITALAQVSQVPVEPLLLVFVLTWILQAVAQLFFWGLKGPGIFGFIGMGIMSVLAWLGLAM
jgi:uncharacterized membrane protein